MNDDQKEDIKANTGPGAEGTAPEPSAGKDCTPSLQVPVHHERQVQQGMAEALRITVASYTADEVIATFERLLATLDFKTEMHEMGIGAMHWILRQKARKEFTALSIAFWKLALEKSFPGQAEAFFAEYRSRSPLLTGPSRQARQMNARLDSCLAVLEIKKETDFSPVAHHLATTFFPNRVDTKRAQLRLSLNARALYTLIFNNLV